MNDFLTLTMLKRYALAMGVLAAIGLLLFGFGKLSGLFTTPQEPERVYQPPEPSDAEPPEPSDAEPPAIPPEVLAKHQAKVERLQAVEAELMKAQSTQNREQMLAHLALEEEMLTLHQEFGTLVVDKGDPFLGVKIGKLMLTRMTDDNQLPVAVGLELTDLLIESNDIESAATVYMATQYALERGDRFFKPSDWHERSVASQPSAPEHSLGTTDPCCPPNDNTAAAAVHPHPESGIKTPQLMTAESVEFQPQTPLSVERFNKARALIDEHGATEGLQRLRESDPDAARRFDRERSGAPERDVPDGRQPPSAAP